MSQKQADRFTAAMNGVLGRIKLGDKAHAEAIGPQATMFRDPQGRVSFDMGYLAMVVLDHNRLLGQDPVAVSIGIRGLLPPQAAFEQAVNPLLEECRRLRDQANNPQPSEAESAAAEADAKAKDAAAFRAKLPEIAAPAPAEPKPERKARERESHFS
jgi:hypothetical protein